MEDPVAGVNLLVAAHPALESEPLGKPGYTLPSFRKPVLLPVRADNLAALQAVGITVEGDPGSDNLVVIEEGQAPFRLVLRFRGRRNCNVVLAQGATLHGWIQFFGDGSLFASAGFGNPGPPNIMQMTLGHRAAAYFGRGCTSVSSQWIIEETGCRLVVGDDLMASWNVNARNYDSHALIDVASEQIINRPGNVRIGPHVWLGQGAFLNGDLRIGAGAVVGASAMVTRDVPAFTAVVGMPAKVVREGVTWARARFLLPAEMADLLATLRTYASPA